MRLIALNVLGLHSIYIQEQESKTFPLKRQTVNILDFEGHMIFVSSTRLCHYKNS